MGDAHDWPVTSGERSEREVDSGTVSVSQGNMGKRGEVKETIC